MLKNIHTYKSELESGVFSILIPSWNNIEYLKLCVESIKKNSSFSHQIIVVVNEGIDGTIEWVKSQADIDYVYAEKNIGICYALNSCRKLIRTDYVLYANDDMYFLPEWDSVLLKEIERLGHKEFMLSATMIEPAGNNQCAVQANYGHDIDTFREEDLLHEYKTLFRADWSSSTWPPNVMHIDCWDLVGGMSIEFSPGMYSDPDLSRKLWEAGVRVFKGKGDSLVYHFGCKSTGRVKKNKGYKTFTLKWGVSARTFMDYYLLRGQKAKDILPEKELSGMEKFKQVIKRIKSSF